MRRSPLALALLALLAGCTFSPSAKESAPLTDAPRDRPPPERPDRPLTVQPVEPTKDPGEQPHGVREPKAFKGDAAHNRPPESQTSLVSAETERTVALPDALELSPAPTFPERPRVAVAFVRGGKLVRRADALRRLTHDFDRDARVESLERFADDAPSQLTLAQLCDRAAAQGALLLLVDARPTDDDADRTTYILTTKAPGKTLAFTRPKTTEPSGPELIARLVRLSRTGS